MELEQEFIEIQNRLRQQINKKNNIDLKKIRYIAGVDLAYWKEKETEYAVCCIVVIDFESFDTVEKVHFKGTVDVPYIPGCLAFREIPLFQEANKKLSVKPDLYVFDGNGYLHPRNMGIATQAGILLNRASIGVAKSYYKIGDTDYRMPDNQAFAYTEIIVNNEVYGRAVRTQKDVRPVFLSIGNQIDLDTANQIMNHLVTKESHIPLPTRLADLETHLMRKQYQK